MHVVDGHAVPRVTVLLLGCTASITPTCWCAMLMTASLSRKPFQCAPCVCMSTSKLSIIFIRSLTRRCTCCNPSPTAAGCQQLYGRQTWLYGLLHAHGRPTSRRFSSVDPEPKQSCPTGALTAAVAMCQEDQILCCKSSRAPSFSRGQDELHEKAPACLSFQKEDRAQVKQPSNRP
jgi:hypothetical protein